MLTLIPWCRRTVHAAGQVCCIGIHPGLTCRRLSQSPNPTGARACELAWEVYGKGSESTVRVLYGVRGPPARFLFDKGVVGGQGAVGRARMEVQELGPLAATKRHPAATGGSWNGRQGWCWRQEGQVSEIWAHRHGCARLGQHCLRQVQTLRREGDGIPGGDLKSHNWRFGLKRNKYKHQSSQNSEGAIFPQQWKPGCWILGVCSRLEVSEGKSALSPCLYNVWLSLLSWWLK